MKIGITGSLASGKSTASKLLSFKRGPLFSADRTVKELYANNSFKSLVKKKFKIGNSKIKKYLKKKILEDKKNIKKLELIIHPLVRKRMKEFNLKHINKKFLFYEIPLLIESKLMKNFDIIIFIKASRRTRLKRFKLKKGDENLFNFLNNKQLSDTKKIKFCDYVVVNEKNLHFLRKKLSSIMKKYE